MADLSLEVTVAREDADLVADALWSAGALAVALDEAADDVAGGAVVLRAGFGSLADLDAALAAVPGARVVEHDEGWRDAWRPFARPVRVGRVVVRPAWVAAVVGPDDIEVVLDPERAFGSGEHPTTRLALAAVVAQAAPGRRVLDVGTGSGVLAVAAARLGAAVVAVDADPAAVGVAARNAARNGVHVDARATPAADVGGVYDLVVANLGGTRVVVDLAPALAARVAPGGTLAVSGLLEGAEQPAARAITEAGLEVVAIDRLEGWCCVRSTPRFDVGSTRPGV